MIDMVWGKNVGTAAGLGGATPKGLYLASYGGGDAIRVHPAVVSLLLRREGQHGHQPLWLNPAEVHAAAVQAHACVLAVPEEDRVPRVPAALPAALAWSSQLLVLSAGAERGGEQGIRAWRQPGTEVCVLDCDPAGAEGAVTCNLMAQGWLSDDELQAEQRQGISRWPLVGIFSPVGLEPPEPSGDPANAGFGGSLAPTDQHAHLVVESLELDGHHVELADWHVGGDTGRLAVGAAGGCGCVALVDLDAARVLECLLVVAPKVAAASLSGLAPGPEEEASVEAVLAALKALIPDVPGLPALSVPANAAKPAE
uniref:Uncharacterized protein n=1 Tax=Alexandrium monilatum TaxID=311494 RepID=A0A7S4RI95_9DINO